MKEDFRTGWYCKTCWRQGHVAACEDAVEQHELIVGFEEGKVHVPDLVFYGNEEREVKPS